MQIKPEFLVRDEAALRALFPPPTRLPTKNR